MQDHIYACNTMSHLNAHNISLMKQNSNYTQIMRPYAEYEISGRYIIRDETPWEKRALVFGYCSAPI